MRLLCRAHIEKANHQEGNVSGIVSPRESETDREEFNKNSMTMMLWWEWYKNKSLSNDSIKSEQASASCDEVSGWSSLSRWAEYCLAHYDLGFPTPNPHLHTPLWPRPPTNHPHHSPCRGARNRLRTNRRRRRRRLCAGLASLVYNGGLSSPNSGPTTEPFLSPFHALKIMDMQFLESRSIPMKFTKISAIPNVFPYVVL